MATPNSQRIGIWVIVVVMAVGTIGTYFALVLGNNNDAKQTQAAQEATKNLAISGYQAAPFDAAAVTELKQEDLVAGTGQEVKLGDKIKVSYTGWTSDGKIFDSTTKGDNVNTPIEFQLSEGSLIEGWTKGIPGVRVNGVRKLTIPAAQAYGATDDGSGRPFGPLQFIVRIEEISS